MVRSAIKFLKQLTSSQQWAALITIVILCTGLSFSYLVSSHIHQQLLVQQQQLATNLVKNSSILLRSSLSQNDRVSANIILQDWVDQKLILSATLYNTEQQPIAEQGLLDLSDLPVFWINQSITDDRQLIGYLRVAIDMTNVYRLSRQNATLLVLSSILLSLILGWLAYLWGERSLLSNRKHIQTLQNLTSSHISSKNKTTNVEATLIEQEAYNVNDHLLNTAINDFLISKQDKTLIHQSLDKFKARSESVDSQSSHSSELIYQPSAIMFINIQGCDELKSCTSASKLQESLNYYHQLLSQIAQLYNGTLDRYIDNGVFIAFTCSQADDSDHKYKEAEQCLYATQLFIDLVNQLRSTDLFLQRLTFRVSAHWGAILLAPEQLNKASPFNLMSDSLHWSSHLACQGKERSALVSQDLLEKLNEADVIEWTDGPQIKGLNNKVQKTHWLDSLPSTASTLISRQVRHILSMNEDD